MSGININLPTPYKQEVVHKECRHNHAASLGRIAFDGCHEFLKGGIGIDNNTRDDMLCAACGCHRSFHRKITIYNPIPQTQPDNNNNNTIVNVNATTTLIEAVGPSVQQQFTRINPPPEAPRSRKKRTMFTAEQRNRMTRFAERLGWRPQKVDKEQIQGFCMDMGISRRMFLVWLSNNRRRAMQQQNNTAATTTTMN